MSYRAWSLSDGAPLVYDTQLPNVAPAEKEAYRSWFAYLKYHSDHITKIRAAMDAVRRIQELRRRLNHL